MKWWIALLFVIPFVFGAEGIVMSAQKEYHFPLNQPASFALNFTNPYNADVSGQFSYSFAQQSSGFSMSNSQSKPLSIGAIPDPIGFDLGTPSTPGIINLDNVKYVYRNPKGEQLTATLPPITVYFEQDPSQQQQEQVESSTETEEQQKKEQEEAQKQEQEQLREQMEQQQVQNQLQNRLQNNQAPDDTNALKQQMQQQLEEQRKMEEEFRKALENSPELQQKMQELMEQGYEQKQASLDPSAADSGNFSATFENPAGDKVELKGEMIKNKMESLQALRKWDEAQLLKTIRADPRVLQYEQELLGDGFNFTQAGILSGMNNTNVTLYYERKGKQATIVASLEDETITSVHMQRPFPLLWPVLVLVVLVVMGVIYYLRKQTVPEANKPQPLVRINPAALARSLLKQAREQFAKKHYKDAHESAALAIKTYYAHTLSEGETLSNMQLIVLLKRNKTETKQIVDILNRCALVEFAKGKADKKEFEKICSQIEKML
jgi:hypothetical protein